MNISWSVWLHVHVCIHLFSVTWFIGSQIAIYEQDNCTIRHMKCQWLLPSGRRCQQCTVYRDNTLRRQANHMKQADKENRDPSNPSSRVNYRYLNTPERNDRMRRLHNELRVKVRSLQAIRR